MTNAKPNVSDWSAGKTKAKLKTLTNNLEVKPKPTSKKQQMEKGMKRNKLKNNSHEQGASLVHFTAKPCNKIQESYSHRYVLR